MLAASFIFIPGTCRCDVKRVAIIQMATLGDFMGPVLFKRSILYRSDKEFIEFLD